MLLFLSVPQLKAQNTDEILNKASLAYETGRFETADSLLANNIRSIKINDRERAYRILALSNMQLEREEETILYASKLLEANPFYNSYEDSPRFADLLEKIKKEGIKVSTASKFAESIEEVPVPVTLITEEMIKASGGHSLADVLLLYLPGFSQIGSIEENNAMRGVYGLSQETILVLVDGHRQNSATTNAAPFDYRNSLDKIKQIEVLRGPASSLYGNVALTAVVNIITKSGYDIDGARLSMSVGKDQYLNPSILVGKGNLKTDFMAWLSVTDCRGEKDVLSGSTHYIGGYNRKPTFDIGAKAHWGDFKLEATASQGKSVPYYNLIELTEIFSYDDYDAVSGNKPGGMKTNIRVDADYSHSWENFSIDGSAFGTYEKIQMYNSLGDTIPYQYSQLLAVLMGLESVKTRGVWQSVNWENFSFGGSVSGNYNYKFANGMSGSALLGAQFETSVVTDACLYIGADFGQINNTKNNVFFNDHENVVSTFLQLKHNFTKRFIFNGGLRYDHKIRHNKRKLDTFSPRISLIWLANDIFSLKTGYSHSFVDAPYFFRGSMIPIFSGGEELNPEKMDAFQVSANFNWKKSKLKYEINLFYNKISDMVYINPQLEVSEQGIKSTLFANAGKINIGGIENTLQHDGERTSFNFNLTYQYPFTVENFESEEHDISNVPNFLANFTIAQKLPKTKIGTFKLFANVHAQSSFNCLNNNLIDKLIYQNLSYYEQSAAAIFGVGAQWISTFGLEAKLDVNNLFNSKYDRGGQLLKGVPCRGFNMVGTISYSF